MKSSTDEKSRRMPIFRVSSCDEGKTLQEVIGRAKVQLIPHVVDESVELLTAILDGREADWRIVEVENGQTLVVHALQTVRERKQIKHGGRGGWVTGTSYRPVTLRVDFAQGDQVIVEEENAEEKSRPMRTMTLSSVAATA